MARYALSTDEREDRRQHLIEAAHCLFRDRGLLPPVADIAKAAGLAKGTVYLYFRSKEEIFVALLEHGFAQLFRALGPVLLSLPTKGNTVPIEFAARFGAIVADSGDLLSLASLGNAVLEQNVPIEPMRRFKTVLAGGLSTAGGQLELRTGLGPAGTGETLLLHTYALTLGLWQALNGPATLQSLLQEPELRSLDRDFNYELEQAIATLWRGHFRD